MSSQVLLDTDTLSAILRQNPVVLPKARQYLAQYSQFTFSLITQYEILRGLKAKQATSQLAAFEQFCATSIILPVTEEIIVSTSDIYADLKRRGLPTGDADILIASSALLFSYAVVTNNEKHFRRIPNLQVLNWMNG